MGAAKIKIGRLTWKEFGMVAVAGALPVAVLGPALMIIAQ